MEFLNRIFNSLFGQSANEECTNEKEKHNNVKIDFCKNISQTPQNYSYLLKRQTFKFHNQFLFGLRYIVAEELWMVGCDFAYGVGFDDAEKAIKSLVDERYVKFLNTIVFKNNVAQDSNHAGNVKCINKTGAFQLLNNIDFDNKAEFIAYLLENFKNLESKLTTNKSLSSDDDKLSKVLTAIETIKKDNASLLDRNEHFKNQVFDKFGAFERRFNEQIVELDKKICLYDNVEQLYNKLRTFHKSKEITSSFSNLSFLSNESHNNDDCRYETVKFPRDSSKYPRLAVYVKSNATQGTDLAFLAGQQKNMGARKRKYQDMELVYDAVHPNPLLALHCINEELENKNFKFCKKSKRMYCIDSDIDTVKSFINENV
ncbi:38.7K protein [Apocheima cinerarium nucleopolyhedrovirus]|uniref:38.7K protein n=1 Tax=Apocheima cinerarium nucleopolyhedrovirus TaxID=307461 RepID=UPI0001D92038|nr:38.7K protein [Apocheima cinerarium nucleopolyhedrovirus]ADB84364.1 38.7K protein [Apocheima cinerarium nucleopolyhedrovirus]